jgi:hypothetical protein
MRQSSSLQTAPNCHVQRYAPTILCGVQDLQFKSVFIGTTPAITNMPSPIDPIEQSTLDLQHDMFARKTSKARVGRKTKSSNSLRSNKSNLASPRPTRPLHSPTRGLGTLRSLSPTAGVAACSRPSSPRRVANTSSYVTILSFSLTRLNCD